MEENQDKISRARSLPYFIKDNRQAVDNVIEDAKSERDRIEGKIDEITKPREKKLFASFEPFSPILIDKLDELRDKKNKLRLFDELLNDEIFKVEYIAANGAKTVIHPLHKTNDKFWKQTLEMAKELNRLGKDVIFLPEYNDQTSADALIIFKDLPTVVDFKYTQTTKWNSLQFMLKEGFEQAKTLVLKLEEMDVGQFKETIDYMKRNNMFIGNILLMNQYGKGLELGYNDFLNNRYKKKIRGFLK